MPHTHGSFMQDLGFTDGRIFCGPGDLVWDIAAQGVVARTVAGQWSISHPAAANTTNFAINITQQVLRRTGYFEDLQEQFGGAGIPASAEIPGRPDTFGSMNKAQQITPRTAFKIKGFKLTSFDVIYSIGTSNLTTHTCRTDVTQYFNNLAPVTTVVLASAANGLASATQAQPYVTSVAIPVGNQAFYNLVDQVIWVEVQAVAAAGTIYNLIGIDALVTFNFN
jgi:hypothetical protein